MTECIEIRDNISRFSNKKILLGHRRHCFARKIQRVVYLYNAFARREIVLVSNSNEIRNFCDELIGKVSAIERVIVVHPGWKSDFLQFFIESKKFTLFEVLPHEADSRCRFSRRLWNFELIYCYIFDFAKLRPMHMNVTGTRT